MLKWVKKPNSQTSLDRIQIRLNELKWAATKYSPSDLSEQQWYEASRHALDLESRNNNIRARKIFAWAIFGMVCVWLTAVLSIVIYTGLQKLVLDKSVLIALITSGSVNVIGLFTLVARYLFHVHETHEPTIEPKIENPHKPLPLTKPEGKSKENEVIDLGEEVLEDLPEALPNKNE